MRIIRYDDADYGERIEALRKTAEAASEVVARTREILGDVRLRGDAAAIEWGVRFGAAKMKPARLAVTEAEFDAAKAALAPATARALRLSHRNVREFARIGLRKDWTAANAQGARVGERFVPFQRVGIYIPGGTAPLISTAIMTSTLAQTAGVPEIVAMTPPDSRGRINPALLSALRMAGATEVYKVGGVQAIGLLAYGSAVVRPVQKIFGPGNAYVVEAKRQVFGRVAVDLLPGPSEILIIADESANPAWVAADLLAQAEHGDGTRVAVVTDSDVFARAVLAEIDAQAGKLSRRKHLAQVLKAGAFIIRARSLSEAAAIANAFAPEHLSIVAAKAELIAGDVMTAGAIFLGGWSPVAAGDFVAGPSHELPTGGAGHSFAGLTVDQFQRRTSIVEFDRTSLRRSLAAIEEFARVEGLDAHARSARIRFEAKNAPKRKTPSRRRP